MADNTKRIALWSGPRNISTTLMYSFAQRKDCKVFDEPLYAHYLSHTNAHEFHPSADEVLLSQENDGTKVLAEMQADQTDVALNRMNRGKFNLTVLISALASEDFNFSCFA